MNTSRPNSILKSKANCTACTTDSTSSEFTCKTGDKVTLATSVQYTEERASR